VVESQEDANKNDIDVRESAVTNDRSHDFSSLTMSVSSLMISKQFNACKESSVFILWTSSSDQRKETSADSSVGQSHGYLSEAVMENNLMSSFDASCWSWGSCFGFLCPTKSRFVEDKQFGQGNVEGGFHRVGTKIWLVILQQEAGLLLHVTFGENFVGFVCPPNQDVQLCSTEVLLVVWAAREQSRRCCSL
jgi:hypothetical protein